MAGEVPPCLPGGAGVEGRGQQQRRPWEVKACPRRSGRPIWTHRGSRAGWGGEVGSRACSRGKSTGERGWVKQCPSQNLKMWPCFNGVFADAISKVRSCWIRVGPESSDWCHFNKGITNTETHGEGHVKTEAETRVTKLQAREGRGWLGATSNREEARRLPLLVLSEGALSGQKLDLRLLASRRGRVNFCRFCIAAALGRAYTV